MSKAPVQTNEETLITGEELFAMGDVGPCELIDGRIVPMSPTGVKHSDLEGRLYYELETFVRARKLGRVLVGEVGIYIRRDPDRIRGADLAFVSTRRLASPITERYLAVTPELVVKIISPTDRWKDIRSKISDYFSIGAERVWIVEPETLAVLVYRSETEMEKLAGMDLLRGEGILDGFSMPVSELFKDPGAASKDLSS